MDMPVAGKYSEKTMEYAVLSVLSLLVVLITVFSLRSGVQVVFTHIYYVPIILAAYWFQKKGVVYSAAIGLFYLACVLTLTPGEENLLAAVSRVIVFTGIACVVAALSMRIAGQQAEIVASEEKFRSIWENIQAAIILVDAQSHEIISANPEAERMTGYTEKEMAGQICHHFICPAEKGKCPIGDLKMTIDHSERALCNREGKAVPVLKTVTAATLDGRDCYIENFINISALKDAENALIAYIREATLRIKNPLQLISDNLSDIGSQAAGHEIAGEQVAMLIAVQNKHMEGIINNLSELDHAIAEKRREIPDALKDYLRR